MTLMSHNYSRHLKASTLEMQKRKETTGCYSTPELLRRLMGWYMWNREPVPMQWVRIVRDTPWEVFGYRRLGSDWALLSSSMHRGTRDWMRDSPEQVRQVLVELFERGPQTTKSIHWINGKRAYAILRWAWKHGYVSCRHNHYHITPEGEQLIQDGG